MSTTVDTATEIRPLAVEISHEQIDNLRRRIAETRWPPTELVQDASQGVQLQFLQELARYWAEDYDFGRLEARLNALPQYTTNIDGLDIHFIHVRSEQEGALPLIITHGWPGSVVEMLDVIGPLTEPVAHGGSIDDAFDVVIPSIPGYGFSSQPTEAGWDSGRIGAAWAELMSRLGYSRYVAQGGDQGAGVTDAMGREAPDGLLGVHFNFLDAIPKELLTAGFTPRIAFSHEERDQLGKVVGVFMRGYISEMGEHPQTIGYSLLDSPIGLAAWMLDHDPDSYAKISKAFVEGEQTGNLSRDNVLDNITLYWVTGTGASTSRLYWETGRAATASFKNPPPHMRLPAAFTVFPDELFQAPRHWVKHAYHKLVYYNEAPKGGHFAAWEEPELFSREIRAAFRSLR
ncbi:MAG TPA: epoxide hydrolase [Gaiellaceae bacterium]|jgi:pimeloyl-ACP methyl ester carboxylesterase